MKHLVAQIWSELKAAIGWGAAAPEPSPGRAGGTQQSRQFGNCRARPKVCRLCETSRHHFIDEPNRPRLQVQALHG
jgi:hypothetical protein